MLQGATKQPAWREPDEAIEIVVDDAWGTVRTEPQQSVVSGQHSGVLCAADASNLNEDLSALRTFFVDNKVLAGMRAVCGVASSLLLINLLQLGR